MSIFDLLFIIIVLISVIMLMVITINLLRGRLRRAGKLLAMYSLGLAIYLGSVVTVSLVSPQRVVALGEDRCFDDWCVAVENVAMMPELGQGEHIAKAKGVFYVITLRLSNHARGREQRASSTAVHLLDGQGRTYDISLSGQGAFEAEHGPTTALTTTMSVGQSLSTVQVFDLPQDAHDIGLTIEHPVGPGPGLFIIGDDASLLHKPTIVRLP